MTTRGELVDVTTKALAGLTDAIAIVRDSRPELARCLRAQADLYGEMPGEEKTRAGVVAGLTWNVKMTTRSAATLRASRRAAIVSAPALERMLIAHQGALAQVIEAVHVATIDRVITKDQRDALLAIADLAQVDDVDEAEPATPQPEAPPPPAPAPGSSADVPFYTREVGQGFDLVRDGDGRVAGVRPT